MWKKLRDGLVFMIAASSRESRVILPYRVLSVTGSGWMVTRYTSGHSSLKRSSSAVMIS